MQQVVDIVSDVIGAEIRRHDDVVAQPTLAIVVDVQNAPSIAIAFHQKPVVTVNIEHDPVSPWKAEHRVALLQDIVALANTRIGGMLIVGVAEARVTKTLTSYTR